MSRSPRRMRSNPLRSSIAAALERLEGRVLLSTYTVSNLNANGAGSLSDAIQQANDHAGTDTINFAPGLTGTIPMGSASITGSLTGGTAGGLTITGPGAGVLSVSGMFEIHDVSAFEMSGLTIIGGSTAMAAIDFALGSNEPGSITNCTITGGQRFGIYAGAGNVTLTGCTVSGSQGFGIYNDGAGVTVIDSTVSGNGGAGISGYQDSLVVRNSTIANNQGAGIDSSGQGLTLTNSTVANNLGGGIVAGSSQGLTVTNSTIVGNTGTTGAGISFQTGLTLRATLNNTIVAGNYNASGAASDLSSPATQPFTGSNNLIGTGGSGGLVNHQNGNIVGVLDPMLWPLGDYGGPTQTMPPMGSSFAVDAGSNALAVGLTTDQRGYNRIFNNNVDIGAVEFGVAPASQVVTNLNASGPGSLSQAVIDANINHGPDTITFAPGLSGTIPSDITVTDDLTTITGPGASVLAVGGVFLTRYGGSDHSPVLNISGLTLGQVSADDSSTETTLTDCTVGRMDTLGSAVIRSCTISGLTERGIGRIVISDSTIRGGVSFLAFGGSGSFSNCAITGSSGDGIYSVDENTSVTLNRCTVSGNGGSGIHTVDGFVIVIDSTISGNGGSGIVGTGQPSLTVSGSAIVNNGAGGITYHGAMAGGLSLVNSTVANNMGGGINAEGFLTVTNSTIVGNVGTIMGGIAIGYTTHINNTIVAGNRNANGAASDISDPGPQISFTGSNNLIGTGGSGGLVNGQNGNLVGVADPKLAPLGNYGGPTQTMPPLAGSPAIDAGSNALAVDENGKPLIGDQRGYYRIVNGKVDIGSVEFNSTPLVPGDANGDGKVDFNDLLILARNYGTTTGATWAEGDFTGDGAVNFDDILILARNFGRTRVRR